MNYKINIFKVVIICFVLIQAKIALCQQPISMKQVDRIFADLNKTATPGASIAIVQNGKTVFKKGYGMASLEFNIPVNYSTVFQVASVSKQVTAFAVLLLENSGKLSLNDDVRKYLPEFPDYGRTITIKNLLFHTSGLRDYWDLLSMAGWRYDDVITKNQLLSMIYRQKGLNSMPGYEYIYSNTGYVILAEIVSKISGMSFSDFTHENIFKPLKMNNTLFLDDNEKVVRNFAESYNLSSGTYKKSRLNHSNTGSTNLLTTVEDMALWAANFEDPVVGSRDLIREMDTPGTLYSGDSLSYAMGQETGIYKGLRLIGHRGAECGYRSMIVRFPSQHLSIIIFANNGSVDPTALGLAVADIILKDKYVSDLQQISLPALPTQDEYTGEKEILKSYSGNYELRPGFIIYITLEDGNLFAEAHELPKSQLIRISHSEFTLPAVNAKLTFSDTGTADKNNLIVDLNGQQMTAIKIKEYDTSSANPDDFMGDFYSPELGTIYTFTSGGGQLFVTHPRIDEFSLIPTGPDQFSSDKSFFNRVEFLRDSEKNVTGCMISAGRIRNINLIKIE